MTIKDLQELIRIFGGEAKVKAVEETLKLIVEIGEKFRAQN